MRSLNQELGTRLEGPLWAAAPAFALAVYVLLKGWIWAHEIDTGGGWILMGIVAPAALFGLFVLLSSLWSLGLAAKETARDGLPQILGRNALGGLLLVSLYFVVVLQAVLLEAVLWLKTDIEWGSIPSGETPASLLVWWRAAASLFLLLFWGFLALFGVVFGYRKTRPPAAAGPPEAGPAPISDVRAYARDRVAKPAIAMMATGALKIADIIFVLAAIIPATNALGVSQRLVGDVRLHAAFSVYAAVQVLLSLVVIVGALKMKRLESYGFAVTSAILAIAICPCDCTSWPLGMAFVWALVVLQDAKVKAAFRLARTDHEVNDA